MSEEQTQQLPQELLDLIAQCKNLSLTDQIKIMKEKREIMDDLKAQHAAAQIIYDFVSIKIIPDVMEEMEVEQQTVTGVGRINIRADIWCSVKKGSKDALHEWMREHDMEDLIVEGINSSTLKAWVKEQTKKAQAVPNDLINITPYSRAVITKK